METKKYCFVVFYALIALSLAAPRGDISEEEDGPLEDTSRYDKTDHFPSVKDIVEKVKDAVDHTKDALHKLKKPVKLFQDIKDKIGDKKEHKWTKVGASWPAPPRAQHGPHHRPAPCGHYQYPPFDANYAPSYPYYYYY